MWGQPELVEVEIDEQGIELGQLHDEPSASQETVLAQIDVFAAGELSNDIAEITDAAGSFAPAPAFAAGDGHPSSAIGVQHGSVIHRPRDPEWRAK